MSYKSQGRKQAPPTAVPEQGVKAQLNPTGVYLYYLPKWGVIEAAWLPEDEFVANAMQRVDIRRCADPYCNREFIPWRDDQRYHKLPCRIRHYQRQRYDAKNGTTADHHIRPADDTMRNQLESELRSECARARVATGAAAIPARKITGPTKRERDVQYENMLSTLRNLGHDPDRDFWKDQLQDLFETYLARGGTLPSPLEPYMKEEGGTP